jgi:hypothetical protein
LMFGRIDDVIFLGWAVAFTVACRLYSKRRRLKHLYSR